MQSDDQPNDSIVLASYTHARTHPWVLGKIGGYTLPTQLTPAQLAVLFVSFLALLWTRGLWAHLGGLMNLLVQIGVPMGLAWALRHLRLEGRSPMRTVYGYATYFTFPKYGQVGGRSHRQLPARPASGSRIFMVAFAPERELPSRRRRGGGSEVCGEACPHGAVQLEGRQAEAA